MRRYLQVPGWRWCRASMWKLAGGVHTHIEWSFHAATERLANQIASVRAQCYFIGFRSVYLQERWEQMAKMKRAMRTRIRLHQRPHCAIMHKGGIYGAVHDSVIFFAACTTQACAGRR